MNPLLEYQLACDFTHEVNKNTFTLIYGLSRSTTQIRHAVVWVNDLRVPEEIVSVTTNAIDTPLLKEIGIKIVYFPITLNIKVTLCRTQKLGTYNISFHA